MQSNDDGGKLVRGWLLWQRLLGFSGDAAVPTESQLQASCLALADLAEAERQAEMLLACAAVCDACAGKPDMSDEWVGAPIMLRESYRHPWGFKHKGLPGMEVGFYACKADTIRKAWLEAHPAPVVETAEASADGN